METTEFYPSRTGEAYRGWCRACGQHVRLLPAEEAARVAGVSLRTLVRWVEAAEVHFTEPSSGALLICLNSLPPVVSGAEPHGTAGLPAGVFRGRPAPGDKP